MRNLRPWFALKSVPGVGNLIFRRLVEHFGSPQAVLDADKASIEAIQGVSPRVAAAIAQRRTTNAADESIDRQLESLRLKGYRLVTLTEAGYPPLLRQIPDPPPFLYVYGALPEAWLNIAVVGSRNATEYGATTTRRLVTDLARQKVTIVSGMARGIDTVAHRAAIAAGGVTVAVLGTGLDCIYPRENTRLFHQMAEQGAVVSEFSPNSGPEAHHFPARNRIISGMSHGALVVEATGRSGSLITARLAAEQNREVFAVPGNVNSFKSVGTHNLIKQGAKLVVHAGDILEEFEQVQFPGAPKGAPAAEVPVPPLTNAEAMVIGRLDAEPVHIDDLVRQLGIPAGRLAGLLLQLELKGLVHQSMGKCFSLVPGVDPKRLTQRKYNHEVTSE